MNYFFFEINTNSTRNVVKQIGPKCKYLIKIHYNWEGVFEVGDCNVCKSWVGFESGWKVVLLMWSERQSASQFVCPAAAGSLVYSVLAFYLHSPNSKPHRIFPLYLSFHFHYFIISNSSNPNHQMFLLLKSIFQTLKFTKFLQIFLKYSYCIYFLQHYHLSLYKIIVKITFKKLFIQTQF